MKSKRQARVFAMQILYALEVGSIPMGDAISSVEQSAEIKSEQKEYGMKLVDLSQEHSSKIKKWIEQYSKDWDISRIGIVERISMSIAMVELSLIPDVPPKVAIKEAIEIARKYSTPAAAKFINGILDSFAKDNFILPKDEIAYVNKDFQVNEIEEANYISEIKGECESDKVEDIDNID